MGPTWIEYSFGEKWVVYADGRRRRFRWYDELERRYWVWKNSRDWRRRQREFKRTGTRYYGDGGTIHRSQFLNIETTEKGQVVAVWFRCQALPFEQHIVSDDRAIEAGRMYELYGTTLHGVEVRDA